MNQELTKLVKKSADEPDFKKCFKGKFYGVLRWHQLDHIWDVIKSNETGGWYIYEVNKPVPDSATQNIDLATTIEQIDQHLRNEHEENYCGIVYADNLDNPEFIKVFDPKSLGTSCSIAKTPPLPKWIISKIKPQQLTQQKEATNKTKRWLGNLFAK